MMKTEKQPETDIAIEFLRMVEDRSKFQGKISCDYVTGFLYSVIKDLARIPDVQEVFQLHLECYKNSKN